MTKLGLDLTATEIKAEATAIKLEKFGLTAEAAAARTGDLTTMTEEQQAAISAAGADLSDFDKAEAGVAISMRKHGQEQDALTAGAKNAANVQKGFKVVLGEMIEEMGKPLVAPMFEIMKSAMPIVKALARAFADFAKAVLPTIMESFRSLQPVINLVVDALKELLPPFIAISSWIFKTFNAFNLLRKVFGDDVFQKFTDWIRQAVVDVKAFIKPVTDAVKAFDWDGALNHLQTVVSTVFTFIGNTISNVWNGIIKPALEAMGWLIENILIPVLKTLWDVQVAVWGAISDVISFAWNNVIKPTYDLMTTVVNNVLIPGFNLLSSVVTTVWNAISTAISFAWNSVIQPAYQGIKSGFQTVIDFFSNAKDTIAGVFGGIGRGIESAFNTAFGAIRSVWNSTVGGFGFDLPGWLGSIVGGKSFRIPKMHEGGLVPGVAGLDVPAILQAGELVISRPQLKALMNNQPLPQAQAQASQPSSPVIGTMTVIGQDPISTAAAVGRELAFQRRFQGGT
jgi:phage-related protein